MYSEGKLYSSLLILVEVIHALAYIFYTSFLFAYHHVKHASFITCSAEGEEVTVDQVPKEENLPVEVGFDICGSSGEPNTSPNQGKPRSI